MRSNEELALIVQQGDRSAMAELWKQNTGLLFLHMSQYFPFCNAVISEDDLMQAAYFALARAVNDYTPDKDYAFTSYLSLHVKNVARDVFGYKNRKDPAPRIISLNAPIKGMEDDSLTIGDSIEDEAATAAMERVHGDWQREQLRACLDDCIGELALEQAAVIRARYFDNKSIKEIADDIQSEPAKVRLLEDKAMRVLRVPKNQPRLRSFLYENACNCWGYGLEAYKNRAFVSMVEVKAGAY